MLLVDVMISSKLNRREAMNDESSACHGYVCVSLRFPGQVVRERHLVCACLI